MEIVVREYRKEDAKQVIGVFRESYDGLRASKGGNHPDETVDRTISRSDAEILQELEYGAFLLVAQVKESGEIAGMSAFQNRWINSFLKTTYGRSMYVKPAFQRGKSGIRVGTLLRKTLLERAVSMGFRKVYGYSTPEAVGFHEKFGAKFFPSFNSRGTSIEFHYYELNLRPSIWNEIRIEPYIPRVTIFYLKIRSALDSIIGRK
jgi:L-amino acid N-acyltransferase YncA